jgi:hypothetical protein
VKNIRLRLLRRIFGPKRIEVTGGWRKLHNEELHNLYSSPSIIRMIKSRRMRWAEHIAIIGKKRNAYRLLVEKPEGKRQLGRLRPRWEDNIKMDLWEELIVCIFLFLHGPYRKRKNWVRIQTQTGGPML